MGVTKNKSLSKLLANYLNLKPHQSFINISLIILGPLLAIATYLFLGPFNGAGQSAWLRFFLLLDLIYVLLIVGIVVVRILYVLSQRRFRLAGSKLHFRLASVFTTMSLLPTITVAVFATVSINLGLEAWFSERVQSVVGTSLSAARSYADEQQVALIEDIRSVADDLQNFKKSKTQVTVTRYGNVLFSRGSILPLLINKINKNEISKFLVIIKSFPIINDFFIIDIGIKMLLSPSIVLIFEPIL